MSLARGDVNGHISAEIDISCYVWEGDNEGDNIYHSWDQTEK